MEEGNNRHLLVIRLSALGDVAMCVPVLLAFRRANPDWKVTVVTKRQFSELFDGISGISVFTAETEARHRGLSGLWRLSRELKKLRPTRIADFHNVLRTRMLHFFLQGSSIPFKRLDKGRAEKKKLTALRQKKWTPLKTTHQRYADVLRALGFNLEMLPSDCLPRKPWPEALENLLAPAGLVKVGIAPFAAHTGKCYPAALMEEVIILLLEGKPCQIFLFGGGSEETEKLAAYEKAYKGCYSLAGKASLSEELALISNLDIMVSMDSGNGHLAAMYGVPVLTLWGVTHPYAGFAPFGQPASHGLTADRKKFPMIPTSVYGNKVPPGYEKAMETIPPRLVFDRIAGILVETRNLQATTTGESDLK